MKTVALITEYNPFHNGHAYHMKQAKALTGADYVLVIMSGDYVQRGVPAVFDKYTRTRMALDCGADLVLELPVCYASGSAEYFSRGAVSLLDSLRVVDALCFGSEAGDLRPFNTAASILQENPATYSECLKSALREGKSFPAARQAGLEAYLAEQGEDSGWIRDFITAPNNILGIEYCRALKELNSSISPCTIQRRGNGYHDEALQETMSSASAIRKAMDTGKGLSLLEGQMPSAAYRIFADALGVHGPVNEDDFSLLLRYKLLLETSACPREDAQRQLLRYCDVSPDLGRRILRQINLCDSVSYFTEILKTRDMTYTRISRALLHILLEITAGDIPPRAPYARILGFRKEASCLLSAIKKAGGIPVISRPAAAKDILSDTAYRVFEKEIFASNLYESILAAKYRRPFCHELTRGILIS